MKRIKTILLVIMLVSIALLATSCGDKGKKSPTGPGGGIPNIPGLANCENWVTLTNYDYPNLHAEVDVTLMRTTQFTSTPVITLSIDGQAWQLDEEGVVLTSYAGRYYANGIFVRSTPLVAGQTYSVSVSINGASTTGSIKMVEVPTLTTSSETFVHTSAMTYSWTLSENPTWQSVYIYCMKNWSEMQEIAEEDLAASVRTYTIRANTVPANWSYVDFALTVENIVVSDRTAFSSENSDEKMFYNMGAAPSENRPAQDIRQYRHRNINRYLSVEIDE